MWRIAMRAGAIAVNLAACSSLPDFDAPRDPTDAGPTVSQIIDKVQCEIADAKFDPATQDPKLVQQLKKMGMLGFDQWVAAVSLTLTVNDTGGLSPPSTGLTVSYIDPLKHAGTSFGFGGGAVLYQQRTRTYTQAYTIKIANITQAQTCKNIAKKWHDFNLEGDLGLKEEISMGLHAFDADDAYSFKAPTSGTPDNFGAALSFDVFKGVTNLGPIWTLVHFKGPVGGLGYVRDDLHKLAVTFQPVALPADVTANEPLTAGAAAVHPQTTAQAVDAARLSNSSLVTNQAIQDLRQSLNKQ